MKTKNLLTNWFFHAGILLLCSVVLVVNVIATKNNSLEEMGIIGRIAGYIFIVDLLGFAFYVIVLKMIFKVK